MSTPPDPYGAEPPFPQEAPPPTHQGSEAPGPDGTPPHPGWQGGYPPPYPQPYGQPHAQPAVPPYGQPYPQPYGQAYPQHPAYGAPAPATHPGQHPGYWQHPMGYPGVGYAPYPMPKPPQSRLARQIGLVIVGLSVLIIVAAFLPWAWVGPRTVYGVSSELGDGIAMIVFALPCLVLGILRALIKRGSGTSLAAAIVAVVLGALIALTGLGDLLDPGLGANYTPGPGVWLTLVAGVALVVVGIVGIVRRR